MAFTAGVLDEVTQIDQGEVITTSPYNIDSYDNFEDGLIIGRFAKLDSGSVDNLDGSATPVFAGVPKRRINKAIASDTYISVPVNGLKDSTADLVNFGRVTVGMTATAVAAATATEGAQVYVINAAANPDNGLVTDNVAETGALIVPDCTFKREKQSGVWVVTIQKYLV
jgi:hypothetical protein